MASTTKKDATPFISRTTPLAMSLLEAATAVGLRDMEALQGSTTIFWEARVLYRIELIATPLRNSILCLELKFTGGHEPLDESIKTQIHDDIVEKLQASQWTVAPPSENTPAIVTLKLPTD